MITARDSSTEYGFAIGAVTDTVMESQRLYLCIQISVAFIKSKICSCENEYPRHLGTEKFLQ